MSFWMEISANAPKPKRGDLIQTNIGDRKERTWMILRAIPRRSRTRRYTIFKARWWQLEPDMLMRLYRSATRNGGQTTWQAMPKPKRKRETFEEHMKRGIK